MSNNTRDSKSSDGEKIQIVCSNQIFKDIGICKSKQDYMFSSTNQTRYIYKSNAIIDQRSDPNTAPFLTKKSRTFILRKQTWCNTSYVKGPSIVSRSCVPIATKVLRLQDRRKMKEIKRCTVKESVRKVTYWFLVSTAVMTKKFTLKYKLQWENISYIYAA